MSRIYDISPFTLLDYPGEIACIVWISGCNLRCVYCHNPDIVFGRGKKSEQELLDFLKSRQGKLTSVVFSGGEATYFRELPELIRKTKAMGFKIKLDTNGTNPSVLRELVDEGLLDYVALDYKCPPSLQEKLLGTARFEGAFYESLDFLIDESRKGRLIFEARTTVSPEFISEADIGWMIEDLDKRGYRGTYYLQNIVSAGEKTLGNIPDTKSPTDADKLPTPKNFTLGLRNFPEKPKAKA